MTQEVNLPPSAQPLQGTQMSLADCISRQAAIDALAEDMPSAYTPDGSHPADEGIFMAQEIYADCIQTLKELPSAQPERLTDDDFETIRIHLNAFKEKLCNQRRWEEAEEYQRILDRFMTFASAQPELTDEDKRLITQLRSYHNGSYAKVIDKLIASTQQMRKKGKWIKISPANIYECSECGKYVMANDIYAYKFCRGCGADMSVYER